MRTLSSALSAALGAPVQRPAVLVQVGFATVRRWSSHATITWQGNTWTSRDMQITDLEVQALQIRGTLTLGNADGAAGSLVLSEGVQDKAIRIWGYDAAATASGDPVLLADAVGATAEVSPMQVRIALRHAAEFQLSPRTYINASAGFRTLQPAGTVLRINGIDFKLDRRA